MKNIIKYTTMLFVAGLLLFSSCEEYLDVNTDPNNPTEVAPDLLLPVAQKHTANVMQASDAGFGRVNSLANLMMYNWSQSDGYAWYPDEFKYVVNASFYQRIWENSYSDALKMYQTLSDLDAEYDNYKAISMIMKAYHYQLLVDLYGDVPYTEALMRGELAAPAYDDAQTIYEDLIVKLSEAITLINTAEENVAVVPGNDDAMFYGDMMMWKQFANSLKLRILVRQMSMSGRDAYIQTQFDAIAAEGSGFITFDAAVNPGYITGVEGSQNPFWNLYGADAGGTQTMTSKATCATDYVLDYLTTTNDPRISSIYELPATGHLGVPQGLLDYDTPIVDAFVPEMVSNIGPGILKGGNMDAVIYTLAECYLNQAEAALNGYLAGDPKAFYESGVEASFDYLGTSGFSTYIGQSNNNVSYDNSTDKLEAIITQKWIATNSITAEQSWFDYSRTGFPLDLPISLLASTDDRPVRIFYPASELTSNGDNVPSQPNAFTDKIFWAN